MISKKTREIVYNKYNGHCAYCGCEIEMKDWTGNKKSAFTTIGAAGHAYAGAVYDSKEDAEKRKIIDENYVTTIKIEWEE